MSNVTLYREYRPTQFDHNIPFQDERDEWIVAPVMRTRDSNVFEESNFQAALKILGGESETVEVHRFGHWGPGWFEIIIVHPGRVDQVEEMQRRLENYPVLDEEDLSMREHEWSYEYLEQQASEMIKDIIKDSFGGEWMDVLFRKIWEVHPGGGHNDGDGDYWDDKDVREIIKSLGWLDTPESDEAVSNLANELCSMSVVDSMQLETALEQFPRLREALDTFMEVYHAS
jgi:hypothetical protein